MVCDTIVAVTLEADGPNFSQLSCTEGTLEDFLWLASSFSRMVSHLRRSFSAFSRCSADCARHARTCVSYTSFQESSSSSADVDVANDGSALVAEAVRAAVGCGTAGVSEPLGGRSGGANASSKAAYENLVTLGVNCN